MKEYYTILEGYDGFQKEETRAFPEETPPRILYLRQLESLAFAPLSFASLASPPGDYLNIKERTFRLMDTFYGLGRHIAHYKECR